jgi:tetratricopeptide (TPR) repeat protein
MQKKTPKSNITSTSNRENFLLPLGIFILALCIRFVYLIQLKSSLPFFSAPILDELYHDTWAQQIASGDWVGTEPFFRAPLYVYLLALAYKIFGHNLFLPRLFQIVLGSLSCVLIFFIAKKLFNRTVGILSGVIASLYAMLIFYDAQLLITSLIVFLDLVLIALLLRASEKPKPLNWFLCGAVLGLSAIARPNILIFVPFILIWMFFQFRNKLLLKAILIRWTILCLGVLLMIAPVTLRNYLAGKDLVLIAWQGGYNFYLGNNPHAFGWTPAAPHLDKSLAGGIEDAKRLAEEEAKAKLKPSQISSFWYRKGVDFILSQPTGWLKLMVKKTIYFWKGYEIKNTQNAYVHKNFSSLFDSLLGKGAIYSPFGLVGPLSIMGLLICLKDVRKYLLVYLFILSYSISVIIFFVCSRFRMPVIPFLIMFCSFSIWWLFQKIKKKNILSLVIALAALAGLLISSNTRLENLVGDQSYADHYELGISYQNMGEWELALEEYKTSLKYRPDFAPSRNNLAIIYTRLDKTDPAIQEYKRAILSDPSYEKSYYNLGLVYHKKGQLDSAIELYLKAISLNERYEEARINLGIVYSQKGLVEKAKEEWRRVLELNPDNKKAVNLLKIR